MSYKAPYWNEGVWPTGKSLSVLGGIMREPPPTCWLAFRALSLLPDPESLELLVRETRSEDPERRAAAVAAIRVHGGTGTNELAIIRSMLEDESTIVLDEAITAVAGLGDPLSHDAIVRLLRPEEPPWKRDAALRALGALWRPEDFDTVMAITTKDLDTSFILAAHADASNWRRLLDPLLHSDLARKRVWACNLIEMFGDEGDRPALEPLKSDRDGHVRKAAERVLANPSLDVPAEVDARWIDSIPADWREALGGVLTSRPFGRLFQFVTAERARTDSPVFPAVDDVLVALRLTPLQSVRAVILGPDLYGAAAGQAHRVAFFDADARALPPSLRNILKEWHADLGLPMPAEGSLQPWTSHGILLLGAALTVRHGEPSIHIRHGWEMFMSGVIDAIAAKRTPVAFFLWGRAANSFRTFSARHVVITSAHPSPWSVRRFDVCTSPDPFSGSRPFSHANAALQRRGAPPIDWSLVPAS